MTRFGRIGIGAFAIALLIHAVAWAQATAQLNGTVKDSSGAVLPGVTITVRRRVPGFRARW
jgi:hypothetical protein